MATIALWLAACCVALALGDITDPGGHKVDLNNLSFILDDHTHTVVMATDSGCYVYRLSRDQYLDVANPGGVQNLEKPLINALLHSTSYRRLADSAGSHFNAEIQKVCSSKIFFRVHEPHSDHH